MTKSTFIKSKISMIGFLCSLLLPTALPAEDTEIFFGGTNVNSGYKPNVMFILDTSSSMNSKDGGTITRLDRMKSALTGIINSVSNINVGLMRFSGAGGPVLYPVAFVDDDACVIESCSTPTIEVSIATGNDDVEESWDFSIQTSETELVINDDVKNQYPPSTTIQVSISTGNDDAEEQSSGAMSRTSSDLEMIRDPGEVTDQVVGLRFNNVNIPTGAVVTNAELIFQVDESAQGTISVEIFGENNINAASFSSANYNLSSRALIPGVSTIWNEIPSNDVGLSVRTPNLKNIVQTWVNNGLNPTSNSVVFVIKKAAGSLSDSSNRRTFESYNGTKAPILKVTYVVGTPVSSATQLVGLRFQDVKIPQGATIVSARLEFESEQTNTVATNSAIFIQNVDNAVPFTTAAGNVSGKTYLQGYAWAIPAWDKPDTRYQSIDIAGLVQQVVNRTGWCGGNAMGFLVYDNAGGTRVAKSYENSPGSAPKLKVTYDASNIGATGGCSTQTLIKQVASGADDGEENLGTGQVNMSSSDLELVRDSQDQIIALRFKDVKIPNGAIVQAANLQFEIDEIKSSSAITLNIAAQAHDDAPPLTVTDNDISSRAKTAASISWPISVTPSVNQKLDSPDIKTVVQEIVSRAGWASGNDLVIIIDKQSGSGIRVVESYDGEPSAAAKLTVTVKWNQGAVSGPLVTVRQRLLELVNEIQYKSGTPIVDSLVEAAQYFMGNNVLYGYRRGSGTGTNRRYTRVSHPATYTGGTVVRASGCTDADLNNLACVTEQITGSPQYVSPMTASCQKNYIVLLSDGSPSYNVSESYIKSTTSISTCADSGSAACGPEYSKWLFENDLAAGLTDKQNITTYTIGFNFTGTWLQKIATDGGGKYFTATSSADLVQVFTNILAEILKVDTTFVSPGAAVNQFNRLTHRDEIYFSLFKPNDSPYWPGNLKRYKVDGIPLQIKDANNVPAVDVSSGFFSDTAQSFWSSVVDGNNVALGGFADRMGTITPRKVFTHTGTSDMLLSAAVNSLDESNTSVTLAMLGLPASATHRTALLQWSRGVDIKDYDGDGDTAEIRKQMADPLHSRPVIVTYGGTDASPDTTIFVATNEGFLYAVDGETGNEEFSFIPQELLPNLDVFYQNLSGSQRPYGLDGSITTYVVDVDKDNQIESADGDKVIIVVGMRRGGRNYYALDVTDRSNPILLWKVRGGVDTGFAELGQTWSSPIVGKVQIGNPTSSNKPKNVIFFSAGYDVDQDNYVVRTADSEGRGLFMVEIESGNLLWSAGPTTSTANLKLADFNYSIPADIRVLDTNGDGWTDQLWVGDMGGQIWRFDIHNTKNTNLLVTGAVVADFAGVTQADARRFYYAPDISLVKKIGALQLNIALGSGYRAHPLEKNNMDRFYSFQSAYVYAKPTTYTKITEADLYDATDNVLGEGDASSKASAQANLASKDGWLIRLEGTGEKVLSQSITINNQILFTTYLPDGTTVGCQAAQGSGRAYLVNIFDATPVLNLDTLGSTTALTKSDRYSSLVRGGIPPTPTPFFPDNGEVPIVLIGPELGPAINFGELTGRTFWFER